MPGGLKLSTGVLVLYADDESFTLMTPQGHMFAGWITFSAYVEDGDTHAQAQVLMRASDPHVRDGDDARRPQARRTSTGCTRCGRWRPHLGAEGEVTIQSVCVDRGRQWSQATNVWQNAGIRSGMLHDHRTHPHDLPAVPAGRLSGLPDAVVVGAGPNGLAAAIELCPRRPLGARVRAGAGGRRRHDAPPS